MNILIVDDHPLMLMALQQTVSAEMPGAAVMTASTIDSAFENLNHREWDLLLLDLYLGGDAVRNPFTHLEKIRQAYPALKIAVISGADAGDHARQVVAAGAQGYIPKSEDPKLLLAAIHIILQGGTYIPASALVGKSETANLTQYIEKPPDLTNRQSDVLTLLLAGMPNKNIARELDIGLQTVKAHITSIMGALQVENRTQVVLAVTHLDKRYPGWRAKGTAP